MPAAPGAVPAGWDCHVHVFDAQAPVATGHYRPPPAALDTIESLAAASGIGHLVLVQPSVYGTDNSLLLDTLRRRPGRHRGVAVVDAATTPRMLASMHDAGVRGVRFNLVSPVGNGEEALDALAPALKALGWHVQWYAKAADLPRIASLQRRHGLRFVLDHYASMPADGSAPAAAWDALQALAEGGAWVKLSAPYRLPGHGASDQPPPHGDRVAGLFGPRVVWGSDWPHTSFAAGLQPGYATLAVQAGWPGLHAQAATLYA